MSTDPRVALNILVGCLEEHLAAVAAKRGADDAALSSAFLAVADAFEEYEDALYEAYEEFLPLSVVDDEDDDEGFTDDQLATEASGG